MTLNHSSGRITENSKKSKLAEAERLAGLPFDHVDNVESRRVVALTARQRSLEVIAGLPEDHPAVIEFFKLDARVVQEIIENLGLTASGRKRPPPANKNSVVPPPLRFVNSGENAGDDTTQVLEQAEENSVEGSIDEGNNILEQEVILKAALQTLQPEDGRTEDANQAGGQSTILPRAPLQAEGWD